MLAEKQFPPITTHFLTDGDKCTHDGYTGRSVVPPGQKKRGHVPPWFLHLYDLGAPEEEGHLQPVYQVIARVLTSRR